VNVDIVFTDTSFMGLRERQADGLRVGRIQCCSILEKPGDKGARTRQMQRASGFVIEHYIQCRITDSEALGA
jgi:hypothetical protein